MAVTYEPIASTTLGSNASSVEFSSLAGTFTDLILAVAIKPQTTDNPALLMQVGNSTLDTGSNYSITELRGNGSSAFSSRQSSQTALNFARSNGIGSSTSGVFVGQYHFMSYANTNVNKTILEASGDASVGVQRIVGLWRSTSAIDRIKVYVGVGGFATGSTFSLYGIRAA